MLQRFEAHETDIPFAGADPQMLEDVCNAHDWDVEDPSLLDRAVERGLATPNGTFTIAGAMFLTDPAPSLGQTKALVEVRRYPDAGVDYDRREEFGGPLHRQVMEASHFITNELGREFIVSGLYRYDVPKLPEVVVREAVANAVAHRSYEMTGTATVIELRPDHVVVRSPGGLPEPVTVENIRQAQAARNPTVIEMLRRFRLAEDAGRGVDVIQDTMQEALLDPPAFADRGATMEVVLPLLSPITTRERAWVAELEHTGAIQPRDRLALVLAARGEKLTNSSVRESLTLDAQEARQTLHRLRDAGLLIQHGQRGGAHYTLAEPIAPPAAYRMGHEDLRRLMEEAAQRKPITNAVVRDLTGLGREPARALLAKLVAEGRLIQRGQRRGTHYLPP